MTDITTETKGEQNGCRQRLEGYLSCCASKQLLLEGPQP